MTKRLKMASTTGKVAATGTVKTETRPWCPFPSNAPPSASTSVATGGDLLLPSALGIEPDEKVPGATHDLGPRGLRVDPELVAGGETGRPERRDENAVRAVVHHEDADLLRAVVVVLDRHHDVLVRNVRLHGRQRELAPNQYRQCLERALSQVPAAGLRRGRRAGGGRADAPERDRARPGAAGVPLRRAARHGEDVDGATPREGAQLHGHGRPDGASRQDLPRVRRDRERHVARRCRDGCRLAARHRRHPRDPRARRAPAGRGPLQDLHPRRGAPAHGRRLERAAQAHRGASAAPPVRLLHDRPREGDPDRALALPDVRVPAAAARTSS